MFQLVLALYLFFASGVQTFLCLDRVSRPCAYDVAVINIAARKVGTPAMFKRFREIRDTPLNDSPVAFYCSRRIE
jgi:hypothetical protein